METTHQPDPQKLKSITSDDGSKQAKLSLASSPVDLLNDDALRAILLRTCASDHDNLRRTCKRFCRSINSKQFRRERSASGWEEVKCEIPSPREQYSIDNGGDDENASEHTWFQDNYDDIGFIDPDYHFHSFEAHILVDEKRIEATFKIKLLPRLRTCFWEMCDSIEDALQALSVQLFTNNAKPRVACLKEALASSSDFEQEKKLLYIQDMVLDPTEYRSLQSNITPKAVRSLLLHETLKERWSLALYVPWGNTQFTEEDEKSALCGDEIRAMQLYGVTPHKELLEERKAWGDRFDALTLQDMRQFLRAGFHQVGDPSVLTHGSNYYVYATPADLDKPLLSADEALDVNVALIPKNPEEMVGDERKLFELIKSSCSERNMLVRELRTWEGPVRDIPALRILYEQQDMSTRKTKLMVEQMEANSRLIQEERQILENGDVNQIALVGAQVKEILNRLDDPDLVGKDFTDLLGDITGWASAAQSNVTPTDAATLKDDDVARIREQVFAQWKKLEQKIAGITEKTRQAVKKAEEMQEKVETELLEEVIPVGISGIKKKLDDFDREFRNNVTSIVARAGSPDVIFKADAIHTCAANTEPTYIDFLMDFFPKETNKTQRALNHLDRFGETSLMVAARRGGSCEDLSVRNAAYETCELLTNQGIDKNIKNAAGLTALGTFREGVRDAKSLPVTLGLRHIGDVRAIQDAREEAIPRFEALLMPVTGPSEADEAMVEDDEESDSHESW